MPAVASASTKTPFALLQKTTPGYGLFQLGPGNCNTGHVAAGSLLTQFIAFEPSRGTARSLCRTTFPEHGKPSGRLWQHGVTTRRWFYGINSAAVI